MDDASTFVGTLFGSTRKASLLIPERGERRVAKQVMNRCVVFLPHLIWSNLNEQFMPQLIEADVVVLATGFEHPDMGFLDGGLFPEDYQVLPSSFSSGMIVFVHRSDLVLHLFFSRGRICIFRIFLPRIGPSSQLILRTRML